ncbi:MAG: hypothetical protein JSV62_13945 [Promethearchaeota archaeon]|nr:MAG: hypothetical protein JSV62_13945 [Candidatus Lokiarchaeota archaeon]
MKYRPYAAGDYHEYFLNELLIPQQKEMLDICLGLDVLLGRFYDNKEKIGISRHHRDRDKPYYCLFEIGEETGEWRVKLVPIKSWRHIGMHNSYKENNNFHSYHVQNDLASARFRHLAELMLKRQFIKRSDYTKFKNDLLEEFKRRKDFVAGSEIRIWKPSRADQVVADKILKDWIDLYVERKTTSEKSWYSAHYNKFYTKTYSPYLDNFARYLIGDPNARNSAFWRWYLSTYLRENEYP